MCGGTIEPALSNSRTTNGTPALSGFPTTLSPSCNRGWIGAKIATVLGDGMVAGAALEDKFDVARIGVTNSIAETLKVHFFIYLPLLTEFPLSARWYAHGHGLKTTPVAS